MTFIPFAICVAIITLCAVYLWLTLDAALDSRRSTKGWCHELLHTRGSRGTRRDAPAICRKWTVRSSSLNQGVVQREGRPLRATSRSVCRPARRNPAHHLLERRRWLPLFHDVGQRLAALDRSEQRWREWSRAVESWERRGREWRGL